MVLPVTKKLSAAKVTIKGQKLRQMSDAIFIFVHFNNS